MATSTVRPVARALLLAAIVVATATGCDTGSAAGVAAPTTGRAASAGSRGASIDALLADSRAARDRHDARTLHAIRARLAAQVGDAAVRRAEATVSQAIANLAAAEAAHDAMARGRSLAALRALCDPISLMSAFGPCPASPVD
jgi:hypothetical protein